MEELVITVDGEPGSGKSVVANWLANQLDQLGHVTYLADNGMEVMHGKASLPLPLEGPLKRQARIRINVKQRPISSSTIPAIMGEAIRPIQMRINCPDCGTLHVDEGEFATKPHHTHSCQHCGLTWRPAVEHTVGVKFLPGFKNQEVAS